MSRLTRDGATEPVSRDQIFFKFSGANGDREMFIFPVQLTRAGLATLPG